LVQHPHSPPFFVEILEVREVMIVNGRCYGFFLLLLGVLFIIYVMVMVVVVLENYEW
jgi:hypothetical protein